MGGKIYFIIKTYISIPMLLELNPITKVAYIYKNIQDNSELKHNQITCETLSPYKIIGVEYPSHPKPISNIIDLYTLFTQIKCKCGTLLAFSKLKRLPEEGWEELIDYWSCHNSEFKSMLDLKIQPRKGEALVSHFYFLANKSDMCCYEGDDIMKIFYNEVNFSSREIIYTFFVNYFLHNNSLRFAVGEDVYEIKLFDSVIIMKEKYHEAFKVGFRICRKKCNRATVLNEYFAKIILDVLYENKLDIVVLNYSLSFIL